MSVSNTNRLVEFKGQRSPGSQSQDFPDQGWVEIDVGPKPVYDTLLTIYDDRVRASTKVIVSQGYGATSDKESDESIMDDLVLKGGNARTGSFELFVRAVDGCYIEGTFNVNYILVNSEIAATSADDMLIETDEF